MVDVDSHSTDLSVSSEEGHSTILVVHYIFALNWGQNYVATLVTPQNCTKMLRNLTFVVQFSFFSIRPKKVFVFLSNFRATFVKKKNNFWFVFEQLFVWEITGNFFTSKLWKALSTSLVFSPRRKTEWESSFFLFSCYRNLPFVLRVVCLFVFQNMRSCTWIRRKYDLWRGEGEGEFRRVSLSRA